MGYKISFRDDTQISASDINTALQQIAGSDYTNVVLSDNTDYDVTDLNEIRKDILTGGLIGYPDIEKIGDTIKISNAVIIAKNGVRVEVDSEGVEISDISFKNVSLIPNQFKYIYLYCFDENYSTGIIVTDTEKSSENLTLIVTLNTSGWQFGPQASLKLENPQFTPTEQTETVTFKNNEFGTVTPNNHNWKRFYFQSLTGNFPFSGYFDREINKMFSTSGVFILNKDINNLYNIYMGNSHTFFVKIYENNDVGILYADANATMKITFI